MAQAEDLELLARRAPSAARLSERTRWRMFLVDRTARLLDTGLRYGLLASMVWFLSVSVNTLAGQKTFADIGVRFLANVTMSQTVAWIFGVGGAGYGLAQRNLRRKETERLRTRLRRLEALVASQGRQKDGGD